MPYRHLPEILIIQKIPSIKCCCKASPYDDNVSNAIFLRYIMLEKHLDFPENLNTKVGAYEQTHEEHENDLELITIGGQSG